MRTRMLAAAALLMLSAVLSACGGEAAPTPGSSNNQVPPAGPPATGRAVVVSSKNFTEAEIIGSIYSVALEVAGVPVERKLNLGTTDVAQAALLKGGGQAGIDLYPEYTNTGITNVLKDEDGVEDPEAAFQAVKEGYKQFRLTWLDKSPMNDTQAMVTTEEVSTAKVIKSLQDLCDKAGELTVAAVAEFKDRPDALPRLQKLYGGCQFKEVKIFEPNLRYQALLNKQVDVAQAFSTDGQIAGANLVLLEDPKGYGLPYNVAPVVRDDVLAAYPQIATALNEISPKITNEEISVLNWQVDGEGREAYDVAKEWAFTKGGLDKK
jgi:osmoprotectant transport system substrate-binding protein